MLPHPSATEIVEQKALTGGVGKYFLWKFVQEIGRKNEEVAVSFVIRCKPPVAKGKTTYPTGGLRTAAENVCRTHDASHARYDKSSTAAAIVPGGIKEFRPDAFIITYDPADVFNISAYFRQIRKDIQMAFRFADKGWRPLVLMGAEPTELVAPWTFGRGGCKSWRGHWWRGEYPFGESAVSQPVFSEPSRPTYG